MIVLTLAFSICLAGEKKTKRLKQKQIASIELCFDSEALKIPDNSVQIGIKTRLKNGKTIATKGFLQGTLKWRNFRFEVYGGKYSNGKIKIKDDNAYRKNKHIYIKVYRRRSDSLLSVFSIPFNYETDIQIIPKGTYRKAPGNIIDLGIRTYYDNHMHIDSWPRNNKKLHQNFTSIANGGEIVKGNFHIYQDPFRINNHTVSVELFLNTNATISDKFELVLDYRDNYYRSVNASSGTGGMSGPSGFTGGTGSNGGNGGRGGDGQPGMHGHDLDVFADVYFDTIIHEELMLIQIYDLFSGKTYNYLMNTDGGTISIKSKGGDGGSGGSGGHGGDGGRGYDGAYEYYEEQINDSTTVTKSRQLPGGDGGHGGCGGPGGNGGHGGDGGNIYFNYTDYAEPYLHLMTLESIPGSGGFSGSGGFGGSGGSGGSGNPSGQSGSSGSSGPSGSSGYSGYSGQIIRQKIHCE